MEKWVKRVVSLGVSLAFTGKENPGVIPYYPQKTVVSGEEKRYFRRSYPEHVGVSSGRLVAMLTALERERRANIHNIIVIKDGYVITECSHPGYSTNTWHLSHSMSKTLTGLLVGLAVDDGLLSVNEKLVDIFPDVHYKEENFKEITVWNLLTMTAGVRFAEAGSISEAHWTEAFFESGMSYVPGEDFSYNSMNTYILGKIVAKRTGRSLTDLAKERILEPLGIENFFWEVGPEGIEKGGWGVYMSVESWAKIAAMMLGDGVFEGKRVLSGKWVWESTTMHAETPEVVGPYNYGYQLWVARKSRSYLFNGMLGQNVWVCPENNIIVAINSGNNELFQNSPAMEIVEKYLGQDLSRDLKESCFTGDLNELRRKEEKFFEGRHWIRPYRPLRGLTYALGLKNPKPYPEEWDALLGRYTFVPNNYGILPLFIRTMQNNLQNGIDGIEFEREGGNIFFIFHEGGETYRLEVGFYDFKTTVIDYHGEKYIVKVIGEAMEDESREMLFKLEILLPEMPNTRMIKFSIPEAGRLLMRMSEMPNHRIADVYLDEMTATDARTAFLVRVLENRIGKNFMQRKIQEMFNPYLVGAKVGHEDYMLVLDGEREKIRASEKTVKLVDGIVKKFFHDSEAELEEETDGGVGSSFRTFISDVVERIKSKISTKRETPTSLELAEAEAEAEAEIARIDGEIVHANPALAAADDISALDDADGLLETLEEPDEDAPIELDASQYSTTLVGLSPDNPT